MSNFRTTADLLDGVLRRCGELTSDLGTSSLQPAALLYLNQLHQTIIAGGNELETDIDESWIWARARRPIIVNLNPPITAGSVTLTLGSTAGTFSTAPQLNSSNVSVEGWYLRADNGPEIYRIVQHTSGNTTFALDGAFPQTSYASTYHCFQLEYELVPAYIAVDQYNDTIDFIESGTTVLSGTITHGSYSPSALATAAAAALNAAGTHGNTYSASYDSIQRLFTVTSNLLGSGTPIFTVKGNGTNFYRTGWNELGMDYLTQSGSASYVGIYPLGASARITQAARSYYGYQFGYSSDSGQVCNLDPLAFDRQYPLIDIQQGSPQYFCLSGEKAIDGKLSVRFNKYPAKAMRVEFEHVPYPKDLQNNAQSIPRIPKKFLRVLEFGASYYLSLDKTSDKAQVWLGIAQQMLKAMMKANRTDLQKASKNFGSVIARPDLMPEKSYRRTNIYGYDSSDT